MKRYRRICGWCGEDVSTNVPSGWMEHEARCEAEHRARRAEDEAGVSPN